MSGLEEHFVADVFASNWIAPLGSHVDAFEREFARAIGASHAVAVSSGTAALHLALRLVGVGPGDEVLVSTLTFVASVNPIVYLGGTPVFVDSERASWNMDPSLLGDMLEARARGGKVPKAVVVVHLYGQSADITPIVDVCRRFDVAVVEDAAEALGATYHGRSPGTFGRAGIYSFNGNKIITTGGGGMLVSHDPELIAHARKLAAQAREPVAHYEHTEVGYNYRLSNLLAAVGRGQVRVLEERVAARRRNFAFYAEALGDLPGITFMPEAPWGRHSRWLTCLTVEPREFGVDRDGLQAALEAENIEARSVWKPMHLQPLFAHCRRVGGAVAEDLFAKGLCLPSGSSLSRGDLERIVRVVARAHRGRRRVSGQSSTNVGEAGAPVRVPSGGKRVFDMLLSALGLALLSPLLGAIALLIKLDDGGQIFFRQVRVGYRGQHFRIWKFRTMASHSALPDNPLTVGDDPRVTRVGRWLRRLKLDELPQLINVLKGEMSLVGPRPELPYYVSRYSPTERRVLDLLPGVTSEASLQYRNESAVLAQADDPERAFVEAIMPEKIRLNLAYGERATLWTDLLLIMRTLRELYVPSAFGPSDPGALGTHGSGLH
jgi:dTDP-4-amino-4,6-dideoxygalactose transaminase/lipopolysaccharide/colanic/teichoic acid biosynthesis glycosyltransferase